MATTTQTCANCQKTGLPILPVRYTVLPNNVKASIPKGISGARVTDVVLDAHHYGVRTLREGWVFLFYEVGARGRKYWEVYRVTADGRLWKQALPLPKAPVTHAACAQRAIVVPMDLIAIEQPEKCTGRVFIAFSEFPWHPEVFDRYAANETLRVNRMQCIEPSKWIGSGSDTSGHAIIATEDAIDAVVEYMPGFDPSLMAPLDEKLAFSDEKGTYKDDLLKREVTRYPTVIRQASPSSASKALIKLMKEVGTKSNSGGAPGHPPMMLALWDSIGTVHELNGFRGDPVAWLDKYETNERALQVDALHGIDTARAIAESRSKEGVETQEALAHQARPPRQQAAIEKQRAHALAGASPVRVTQIRAYYDDLLWIDANELPSMYQTRLVAFGRASSAGSASSTVPYVGPYRDQIMNDAHAYAQAKGGMHERSLKQSMDFHWSRYEARLKRQEIEKFRKNYSALQTAVFKLQEARAADVGKWVQAKLFLDTLEDYDSVDLEDAEAFEKVVQDAIAGLGSTPKGKAIVEVLVKNWDPLKQDSLIWRVYAMNHKDGRAELGKLLNMARANKEMPLEGKSGQVSPGVDAVFTACSVLNKLDSYYKNIVKLKFESKLEKVSPLGVAWKKQGLDLFAMTVGDSIFAHFRIDKLGAFVGEKIIQTLMLQRAGVSRKNAFELVRKQAEFEMLSREETTERLLKYAASSREAGNMQARKALYDAWRNLESTDDCMKAGRNNHIAVVAALLEAVNFYKIMSAAHDKDTVAKLVQSGASMLASLIAIAMTPYYGVLKNSPRAMTWKMIGTGLSSFGTFVTAWLDTEKTIGGYRKDQYDLMTIYGVKAVVGYGVGGAIAIEAISTAEPLLTALAKRNGTRVVIGAVDTVTTRAVAWSTAKWVTRLGGWEATIGLLVLQTMADWLTPDALESWCSRCAFGTGQETIVRLKDHIVEPYTDSAKQKNDLDSAMTKFS